MKTCLIILIFIFASLISISVLSGLGGEEAQHKEKLEAYAGKPMQGFMFLTRID
jgi:hypothetical protein